MRIVLLVFLLCGVGCSEDIPPIPQPYDVRAWDNALKPKEDRIDPMSLEVGVTKVLTKDVKQTWLRFRNFWFTLVETEKNSILLQGGIHLQVLHIFNEKGLRIIVTSYGIFIESQSQIHLIKL